MNSSMMSADSSPFDALEEYNPDLIFVKLWVSDPVLAVILSDQFTDHEEDFLQTYATERQLKLYRMLEKKHPRKYNNGRYNVGSTEGASASGPIIIGMTATDMSTTQGGMAAAAILVKLVIIAHFVILESVETVESLSLCKTIVSCFPILHTGQQHLSTQGRHLGRG